MVKIFHLTDLHFGYHSIIKDDVKRANLQSLNSLLLEKIKSEIEIQKPQIILISGDIIDGKSKKINPSKQDRIYNEANRFIKYLFNKVGKENVIFGAGNHDHHIEHVDLHHRTVKYRNDETIFQNNYINTLIQKTSDCHYRPLTNLLSVNEAPLLEGFGSYFLGYRILRFHDSRIAIISTNSDWMGGSPKCSLDSCTSICHQKGSSECGIERANEYARLRIGSQINDCISAVENCDFILGMMHHPPDWLHFDDRYKSVTNDAIYKNLSDKCDFLFMGHIHPQRDIDLNRINKTEILSGPQYYDNNKLKKAFISLVDLDPIGLSTKKYVISLEHSESSIKRNEKIEFFSTPDTYSPRKGNVYIFQKLDKLSLNHKREPLSFDFKLKDFSSQIFPEAEKYFEYYTKCITNYKIDHLKDIAESFSIKEENSISDYVDVSWFSPVTTYPITSIFDFTDSVNDFIASPIFWRMIHVLVNLQPCEYKIHLVDNVSEGLIEDSKSQFLSKLDGDIIRIIDLINWFSFIYEKTSITLIKNQ